MMRNLPYVLFTGFELTIEPTNQSSKSAAHMHMAKSFVLLFVAGMHRNLFRLHWQPHRLPYGALVSWTTRDCAGYRILLQKVNKSLFLFAVKFGICDTVPGNVSQIPNYSTSKR